MNELDEDARGLLARGLAHDGPSAERRARVKQRLLLAFGSGVVSLGAAASAAEGAAPVLATAKVGSALGLASLAAWFGGGVLAGVVVAGAVAVLTPAAPPRRTLTLASAASVAPAPATVSVPARAAMPAPAPVAASAPARTAAPVHTSVAPVLDASSSVREEALLLQRAQRALAAGAPSAALALLDDHARRFPAGQLTQEGQVARVLCLCALGRTPEARALAARFRQEAPSSVLIPRLARSCAAP